MTNYESSRQESGGSNDERRDLSAVRKRISRAFDEFFHVEAREDSEYAVFSGSGETYTVNLPEGTCTCPDGRRGPWCKHAFRAAFVTGAIPDIDGVRTHVGETDETDADDLTDTDDEDGDDTQTLAERVERFEQANPGTSAIEAISQLGIDPGQIERVEEVLA